jgi:ABC-type Zn uptake system ZnuABC Zn-binding protein ZnuA
MSEDLGAARREQARCAGSRLLVLGLALVLSAAACGRSDGATGPSPAPGALRVVATTTVFADLVREVGGVHVSVESLVPKGGEVHTFDPTPADVLRVSQAQLIVANGLGLDDWLTGLAGDAGGGAPIVRLAEDLPGVTYLAGGEPGSAANPHLWLNVGYASKYVDRIEAALAAAAPADAAAFRASADTYRATLATLDADIRDRLGALPTGRRVVVSFHDAFPYFAAAYGLDIVGSIVDSPGQDPSAGALADLIERIRASGARAIFAEAQFSPKLAETIAGETGATIVTDLYTDTVGDPPADTYVGLMRADLERVLAALSGS